MKVPYVILATTILLSACAAYTEQPIHLLGDPAPISAATSTITIGPDTKWVNVTGGDTVRFNVGEKSFAWTFNVARGIGTFDLSRVAPPGMLGRRVDAYVAPDPRYIGGDAEERGTVK